MGEKTDLLAKQYIQKWLRKGGIGFSKLEEEERLWRAHTYSTMYTRVCIQLRRNVFGTVFLARTAPPPRLRKRDGPPTGTRNF